MQLDIASKWGALCKLFNTKADILSPSSADNVIIAWPEVLKLMQKYEPNRAHEEIGVLDYGCGAGGFCNELYEYGYRVGGIDISADMIKLARENSPHAIPYLLGDYRSLQSRVNTIDIITSIMVFQFIEDLSSVVKVMWRMLCPGGLVVFAALNPAFAEVCAAQGVRYENLNQRTVPATATAVFKIDVSFTTWLRSVDEFKKIFSEAGFTFLEMIFPGFPPNFAIKFGWTLPTNVPEFLVMAFQKPMSV